MNKRTGFFKRIGPPVVLTIGRSNQVVKTGDVILADFDSMMQREGWKFEPHFNAKKEKMEIRTRPASQAQENPNQLIQISNMQRRELTQQPRNKSASESMIDKSYQEMIENNTIKLSNLKELERDERADPVKTESNIEVNFDKLKELKTLKNNDWIKYTKQMCHDILNEAHIDHNHIPNEKWELVNFIKSVIQDIE